MPTLQELADKEGVTRQAIWFRTAKGKAYLKSDKRKAYQKARWKKVKLALKEYNERHPNK